MTYVNHVKTGHKRQYLSPQDLDAKIATAQKRSKAKQPDRTKLIVSGLAVLVIAGISAAYSDSSGSKQRFSLGSFKACASAIEKRDQIMLHIADYEKELGSINYAIDDIQDDEGDNSDQNHQLESLALEGSKDLAKIRKSRSLEDLRAEYRELDEACTIEVARQISNPDDLPFALKAIRERSAEFYRYLDGLQEDQNKHKLREAQIHEAERYTEGD